MPCRAWLETWQVCYGCGYNSYLEELMKTGLALLTVAFFATNAFAHVEPGIYEGKTADGEPCKMTALRTYYVGGARHPLNERVDIRLDKDLFVMAHPSVIETATAKASFNHDMFQGVRPTAKGAQAMVIVMGKEGEAEVEVPKSFHWIDHIWKTDERQSFECRHLKRTRAE